MKQQLLPKEGQAYKANLHCHTVFSDGKMTPAEVKELYRSMGYSIVAYTDHDILIPHDELTDDDFLALHGFEIEVNQEGTDKWTHRKCFHACMIGIDPENIVQPLWHRSKYLFGNAPTHRDEVRFDESQPDHERIYSAEGLSYMMQTYREKGFFVTYNHPSWSMEQYPEYTGYSGMHAFEIFNGGSFQAGFDDYNPRVYDDILRNGERIYCIGADDNHNTAPHPSRYSDAGVAFTVIKAPALEYRAVTQALLNGDFYASNGPMIQDLWYEDGVVHIQCDPADRITCTYGIRDANAVYDEDGSGVIEASFAIPADCIYFRLTVTDRQGRHACTNAYFMDTLEKSAEA